MGTTQPQQLQQEKMSNKDDTVYRAKLAEQAERYDEMVAAMKEVATELSEGELEVEERNLLSVAYKNAVGARRASWRVISSIETKEQEKNLADHVEIIQTYKQKIEEELEEMCNSILNVLQEHLLKKTNNDEATIFYHKMAGDYYRYLAETASGDKKREAGDNALASYKEATERSSSLATTHPIRLGLSLNFSVFYYEILNQPDMAIKVAKQSFDDAIGDLDAVKEETYKDSTLIMQLLRDNLTLWTSENEDPSKGEGDE